MSWFDTDGKASENVLFSKFTYIRNTADAFYPEGNAGKMPEIISRAEAILKKNGFTLQQIYKKSDRNTVNAMQHYEKQYADIDFCEFTHDKAIFFNQPCSLSVSVGGANLINIYAILPGACIRDAYKICSSAEELLDGEFDFVYDDELGYLSPAPYMCGSGIRISCALFLPFLAKSQGISSVCASLSCFGVSLYPLFNGANSGNIYIMTYAPAQGCREESAVATFEKLIEDIVKLEMDEKRKLSQEQIFNIAERASRALGGLAYSTSLCEDELIRLTSDIRLCISAGCSDNLIKRITPSNINSILFEALPSSLMANSNTRISSQSELDAYRAAFVRGIITSLPEKNALVNT